MTVCLVIPPLDVLKEAIRLDSIGPSLILDHRLWTASHALSALNALEFNTFARFQYRYL